MNRFFFALFATALGFGLIEFYRLPDFQSWDLPGASEFEALPGHDYLPMVKELIASEDYDTALAVIEYVRRHNVPNRLKILGEKHGLVLKREKRDAVIRNAVSGFIRGDSHGIAGDAGSVAADFLLWGDIRDLVGEMKKWFTEEDADELTILFSGIGIGSSIASLFPGSTPAGAPVEVGAITLKALRKKGALTDEFVDSLKILIKQARDSGDLGSLRGIFDSLRDARKHCPPDALPMMMKQVRSPDDLKRLAIAVRNHPNETVVIFKEAGPDAMKVLRALDEGYRPTDWGKILEKGRAGLAFILECKDLADRFEEITEKERTASGLGVPVEAREGTELKVPAVKRDLLNQARNWLARRVWLRRYVLTLAGISIGVGAWCFLTCMRRKRRLASLLPG